MPELIEEFTSISNISHFISGTHAPPLASIVRQMKDRNNKHLGRDVRRFSELYIIPHLPDDLKDAIAWRCRFFPWFLYALKRLCPDLSERLRLFKGIEDEGWRQLFESFRNRSCTRKNLKPRLLGLIAGSTSHGVMG